MITFSIKKVMKSLMLLVFFSFANSLTLQRHLPPHPVIGVYTQKHSSNSTKEQTYIAASYVKFIEMSGAQVVPIYSFSQTAEILDLMKRLNGVFFTGGGLKYFDISDQWTKNANAILNFAKDQNDNGHPFPILGTCQGYELLTYLTSNFNHSILTHVHGDHNTVLPISFAGEGYIFKRMSQRQKQKMTKNQGILFFNHDWAITLDSFNTNLQLKDFWNLVATSVSHQNEKFVAALQSKRYPFYLIHFHPEKNQFEWKVNANRSLEAIQVTQIISNSFVDIARKSHNRFSSALEFMELSIYNFQTQTHDEDFTQIYLFHEAQNQIEGN